MVVTRGQSTTYTRYSNTLYFIEYTFIYSPVYNILIQVEITISYLTMKFHFLANNINTRNNIRNILTAALPALVSMID